VALPVLILAGGLGTRLGSLGSNTPKILIPIRNTPFIELQLRWLIANGVSDITYCVGHLGDQIVEHVESLELPKEVKVKFSWDGQNLRGTGGAIAKAIKNLEGKFLIVYGDSFLRADLKSVELAFMTSNMLGLMTIYRNRNRFDVSNVEFIENKVTQYRKNDLASNFEYIDYGIVGFDKEAFAHFSDFTTFDLSDVLLALIEVNQLFGFEIKERFFEIGSLKGIQDLEEYLSKNNTGDVF
jgi:NDP-sugar pyrophosphorylase family protein